MRSPALAIGWEIWARSRSLFLGILITVLGGALLNTALRTSNGWAGLANSMSYALTALALLMTLGCFHFTEGSKKGGFGSFPMRLFHLPLNTRSLAWWPMLYGAVAVVSVYLLCAVLLLRHLGPELPLLWPCLYLVFGLTQFQMIIWSLPESRYLKLLCLSIAASIITFGWMFFVPNIVAGALSEWGYTGDPERFMRRLMVALALTGPAAYVISLYRLRRQRHGVTARSGIMSAWWELSFGRLLRRRTRFHSADQAILWQEWRRTGFILPTVVLFIFALTCLPAWLSGGLGAQATLGILTWLLIAPFLFAVIIGRGFGKPDFWSTSLKLTTYNAIRPVTTGQWVAAKLKVALASATLTWGLTIYFAFVWTALVGDLEGLFIWRARIRFYYSPVERWLMLIAAVPTVIIITWRFLVVSLAASMSGRPLWYHLANGLVGIGLVALFVLTIWRADNENHSLHLYNVWPAIAWLPVILTIVVVGKISLAARTWSTVLHRGMASPRSAVSYFAAWVVAVGILAMFFSILCWNTLWLRYLLMIGAILIVPLARPALAMRSLAFNRTQP